MSSIRHSIAPVFALLFGVSLLLMGNGLQGTLLPVRGNLETFSYFDVGVLGSFYYLGFTIGCFAGPLFIARSGHIRAYLALVSIASTVALLHAIIVDPKTWWLLRGVTGFCVSVLFITIESWLNERSDNQTRATVFSIYMIINMTVITLGQLMLNLADPKSFTLFAIASILVSLASVPIAMTRSQSPQPIPVIMPDIKRLFLVSPASFIGCFSHGLVAGTFWSLGPVFALNSGLSVGEVGLFMSMAVLGGAFGQWPLGRISDMIDRRYVILVTCICSAIAGISMSLFNDVMPYAIFVFSFLYGFFSFPLYSVVVAHANDFSKDNDYVAISSGLLFVLGVGSIIGPVLASLVDGFIAKKSMFFYTAVVYVVTALVVWLRMRQRSAVEEEDKSEFKDALVASESLSAVDIKD